MAKAPEPLDGGGQSLFGYVAAAAAFLFLVTLVAVIHG